MGFTLYLLTIYLFLFVADVLAFIKGKKKTDDTFYSNYYDNNN